MWSLFQASIAVPKSPALASYSPTETPLVVGVGRTPGGPREWRTYAAVFAQLQKDLGRPVVVRYARNRPEIAELVADGKVDIAVANKIDYLSLQRMHPVTLVAAPVIKATPEDTAVMVVAASSRFERLGDLKGYRLVLTTGVLASQTFAYWLLEARGLSPQGFFGSVEESGTLDQNLASVARGRADATCANRSDLSAWPEGTFRVVSESPAFGPPPVIARQGLDSKLVEQIRQSLLSVRGRGVIPERSAITGFLVPSDDDYDFTRELMQFASQSASASASGPKP